MHGSIVGEAGIDRKISQVANDRNVAAERRRCQNPSIRLHEQIARESKEWRVLLAKDQAIGPNFRNKQIPARSGDIVLAGMDAPCSGQQQAAVDRQGESGRPILSYRVLMAARTLRTM